MGGRRCPAAGRERLRTVRRLGLAAQPVARPNACANGRRSWPVRRAEERDRALQGRACRSAGRWGRCADAPGCDPEHWTIGPPSIRSRPAEPLAGNRDGASTRPGTTAGKDRCPNRWILPGSLGQGWEEAAHCVKIGSTSRSHHASSTSPCRATGGTFGYSSVVRRLDSVQSPVIGCN